MTAKPWKYVPLKRGSDESLAELRRSNVQAEIAARLNRAGVECASGGNVAGDGSMDIILGDWSSARKLLRLLRQKEVGS